MSNQYGCVHYDGKGLIGLCGECAFILRIRVDELVCSAASARADSLGLGLEVTTLRAEGERLQTLASRYLGEADNARAEAEKLREALRRIATGKRWGVIEEEEDKATLALAALNVKESK